MGIRHRGAINHAPTQRNRYLFLWVDMGNIVRQYSDMFRAPKKFVAVLLAIWFPLFSGNALAAHVAMQLGSGHCQVAAVQQDLQQSHQHAAHQTRTDANQIQTGQHHAQQSAPCNDCGVCHLACCGYITAVTLDMAEVQSATQVFPHFSTAFQSYTSAPLDPPPLARA